MHVCICVRVSVCEYVMYAWVTRLVLTGKKGAGHARGGHKPKFSRCKQGHKPAVHHLAASYKHVALQPSGRCPDPLIGCLQATQVSDRTVHRSLHSSQSRNLVIAGCGGLGSLGESLRRGGCGCG